MNSNPSTIDEAGWIGPVSDGKTRGYIDRTGKWTLQLPYQQTGEFREGLAAFVRDEKLGFINMAGDEVIKPYFDPEPLTLPQFREGLAPVYLKGEATYVNPFGEAVIPPRRNTAYWNFVNGKALMVSESRFFVIDRWWQKLSTLDVRDIPYFYDFPDSWDSFSCLVVVDGEFRRAQINWEGTFTFPPMYTELGTFVNGIAPFAPHDQLGPWGLVRSSGEVVLPATYFSIGNFVDGAAPAAREKKKFGYIDVTGEWLIPPIYQQAVGFRNGLACVTVPGKHRHGNKGFINRQGEMVIAPRYFRQSSFWHRDWAFVEFEGKDQVIDRNGNLLWETPAKKVV